MWNFTKKSILVVYSSATQKFYGRDNKFWTSSGSLNGLNKDLTPNLELSDGSLNGQKGISGTLEDICAFNGRFPSP